MSVIIDGTDIDNLRLITSAGWSVAGQIITEDGTAPSFPPTRARIGSQLVYDARAASAGVGTVNEDWTFSIRAILGPARLFATVPDGWMVKAIRRNDRDISEAPLELKSGEQLSDVQVVVTNRVTSVVGQLHRRSWRAAPRWHHRDIRGRSGEVGSGVTVCAHGTPGPSRADTRSRDYRQASILRSPWIMSRTGCGTTRSFSNRFAGTRRGSR